MLYGEQGSRGNLDTPLHQSDVLCEIIIFRIVDLYLVIFDEICSLPFPHNWRVTLSFFVAGKLAGFAIYIITECAFWIVIVSTSRIKKEHAVAVSVFSTIKMVSDSLTRLSMQELVSFLFL